VLTTKYFFFGLMLSWVALLGVALMLLPAMGFLSGMWVVFGIILTTTAVILEQSCATWYDVTIKPPHVTGIIIITTTLTYVTLTLIF